MREFDLDHNDDMFADTRMSFGEHIEELRTYLIRAILGFCVAMGISFFLGQPVLERIIIEPVQTQVRKFYAEKMKKRIERLSNEESDPNDPTQRPKLFKVRMLRAEAVEANKTADQITGQDLEEHWLYVANPRKEFAETFGNTAMDVLPQEGVKAFNITEPFMVYFKVSVYCGLVLASPWIFYQLWAFVAAGLYPHERRYVHVYLPLSLALFLIGVAVCQFVVLPKAIEALLFFNEWLNVDPELRINEWLSFAIMFPLVMGLSFQTPLVMMFLERLGILEVEVYRRKRRIAYFVLLIVAAIGPSIDPFSLMIIWVSLCLLYELGIWLCLWSPRSGFRTDVPEPEEMVEV